MLLLGVKRASQRKETPLAQSGLKPPLPEHEFEMGGAWPAPRSDGQILAHDREMQLLART